MQNDILQALDFNKLTPEEQEELLLDLGDLVFNGTLIRLRERMDEATAKAFDEFLTTEPSSEEMAAYLSEHIPGADEAVHETVDQLRSDILAVTG